VYLLWSRSKILGAILAAGISTDKITAIKEWPIPRNKKSAEFFWDCARIIVNLKGFSLAKPFLQRIKRDSSGTSNVRAVLII